MISPILPTDIHCIIDRHDDIAKIEYCIMCIVVISQCKILFSVCRQLCLSFLSLLQMCVSSRLWCLPQNRCCLCKMSDSAFLPDSFCFSASLLLHRSQQQHPCTCSKADLLCSPTLTNDTAVPNRQNKALVSLLLNVQDCSYQAPENE